MNRRRCRCRRYRWILSWERHGIRRSHSRFPDWLRRRQKSSSSLSNWASIQRTCLTGTVRSCLPNLDRCHQISQPTSDSNNEIIDTIETVVVETHRTNAGPIVVECCWIHVLFPRFYFICLTSSMAFVKAPVFDQLVNDRTCLSGFSFLFPPIQSNQIGTTFLRIDERHSSAGHTRTNKKMAE